MELLLSIFSADILPVFCIAGTGFALARYGKVDVKTVSRVVFYSLLPCLVFRLLVTSGGTPPNLERLIAFSLLQMMSMGVVGYLSARASGLRGRDLRAFLMVVMFSNGGNYGLPVVRFAFGEKAFIYATMLFLTSSVTTYVVASFFASGQNKNRVSGALEKVVRMPTLYGAGLALITLAAGWNVPTPVLRPITLLSDAALPLMILILGMQIERAVRPARPGIVLLAVAVSLLAAPLIALSITSLLGIAGSARQAAVTVASMPVAVVTTILALEYDLAPDFVTSAVLVSTVASPFTITPLVAYLQKVL